MSFNIRQKLSNSSLKSTIKKRIFINSYYLCIEHVLLTRHHYKYFIWIISFTFPTEINVFTGIPWRYSAQDSLCSHCQGPGSIPGWGTEIPQAVWRSKKKKKYSLLQSSNKEGSDKVKSLAKVRSMLWAKIQTKCLFREVLVLVTRS